MKKVNVFSTHIFTKDSIAFCKDKYSRFKYGSKSVAREFGKELGVTLFGYLMDAKIEKGTQIVIAPSPYMFIPTATFALKDYLISTLNPLLIKAGYKVVQETKVFRQTGYTEEYGSLSKQERSKIIGSESFHTDAVFLKDKYVVFLDDIKITGAHQERMEEMVVRLKLDSSMKGSLFAYFAELKKSGADPDIENHLNYFSIKSLLDLDKIIKNEEFVFNTRNVKYILNAPHIECVNFLEYQRKTFIETLYHLAIGNSFHLENKFSMNFQYLQHLIN